jgi:transaldolase
MAIATADLTRKEALLAELARNVTHAPERAPTPASDPVLAKLNQLGTQLWLDTGNLEEASRLWRREMSALTTNNTLANQVVQTGLMDDVIKAAARQVKEVEPGISLDDLVLDVVFVVNCHIALRLVKAFGALVSVELHPGVSHDIEKTVRYAHRYYAINPEHFIVKIPLTPEGYCAVARVRADGIPINYTLGFSARQNYLAALLSKPNYVNVFLGRLNAVVADNKLGDGKFVGEKVTLASQAAVREVRTTHSDVPTHQIAASMRNAEQMVSLAGVDVFTIPPKAVEEFYGQGHKPEDITSRVDARYEVTLADTTDKSSVEVLWTVDDRFKKFAQELADRGGVHLTGDDLRQADKDHGTHLFANFTAEEQAAIRAKGKIPETARWQGRASLDDLMTESALQSFTTDQDAFDNHIRELIANV